MRIFFFYFIGKSYESKFFLGVDLIGCELLCFLFMGFVDLLIFDNFGYLFLFCD